MRIALLTEGGLPQPYGDASAWCDRLVRGLAGQDFEVFALARAPGEVPGGRPELPPQVRAVHILPVYGAPPADGARIPRRRFLECYQEFVAALTVRPDTSALPSPAPGLRHGGPRTLNGGAARSSTDQADRFAASLYGLAELAREHGGLPAALRSETAIRALEAACRAPGAEPLVGGAQVRDLLTASALLERALRPLSVPWYGECAAYEASYAAYEAHEGGTLASADLCHATTGGPAALPGIVAKRFCGTPLLITEYAVRLREHYLGEAASELPTQVRALLAAFHRLLAGEVYRQADLITPGNAHVRRWQERCGAPRTKIRTVHPGMDAGPLAAVGEAAEAGLLDADELTLAWVGRAGPDKDLVGLLHAFADVRKEEPSARLRIISADVEERADDRGGEDTANDGPSPECLDSCRALAAQLFPDEAADAVSVGENPVSFEEVGSPYVPERADAYAAGAVVVLSSVVEGFPLSLVEAMFCGRPTVSTDVGAVREVIGGTGLVVPPRNPRALAEACVELLRDPERRARLGAAARARALELFTVEQNIRAFREIYLDLVAHREPAAAETDAVPFALPAEAHLPGTWTGTPGRPRRGPAWAARGEREYA
ncbi:DUF3492 domain-containing protein [Streptomyces sp. RB6PN25]|uniref:D-inositol 3-phosphate glycosyltransferase n=1 Tax=Streptomyces humicola TaxID=2953240 RepID=A0ABT1PRE0_9ACTN|nr:glycosyltransferase [Streptomyces humicola]MCQ4080238.1 DUF3492 domain-containing protein [Streptomyces humicola]